MISRNLSLADNLIDEDAIGIDTMEALPLLGIMLLSDASLWIQPSRPMP